jgi:hypothetical protein
MPAARLEIGVRMKSYHDHKKGPKEYEEQKKKKKNQKKKKYLELHCESE